MKGSRMKKGQKKKCISARRRGSRGIITVFVTLIMVPVVAITGIMVDVSRLKLYSSQAVMAADAYGEVILSEFDNLLKELYGLFSVTQNKEGLAAIDTLAKHMGYSFNPNGDKKGLSGFMPYQDADVVLTYEKVPGASLSDNNVLMTQIAAFMKYRVVQEALEAGGILDTLGEFDSLDSDMDAMESRNEITDSCSKALGQIDDYYQELKKLAAYPDYIEERQEAFEGYSKELTDIAKSDEYAAYVEYLEDKTDIDAAKEKYDRIAEGNAANDETMTAEEQELYEKYVDVEAYKEDLEEQLEDYETAAGDNSGDPIHFDNTKETIQNLEKHAKELEKTLKTLDEQVEKLQGQLESCSEEVKEGIRTEIEDLKKITEHTDDFMGTYELIETTHKDIQNNADNQELMEEQVPKLDTVKENLLTGNVEPGDSYWAKTVPLLWYDFQDDEGKKEFYQKLKEICESENDSDEEGDKKAGDKKKKEAEEARKKAEKELEGDEETGARDITAELASQLGSNGASGNVPSLTDYFSGGLSFKKLAQAGSQVVDRILLAFYDFGMFSSRVSGVRPEGEEAPAGGDSEEYADYSLTKVKMSKDVNYLYGAELEYLLGGYNSSVSNLNHTRNIICGVRLAMNFASSYSVREVNETITTIADTAAKAVAATGVGAAAAPLVRVAVSGALRLAFATMETAADWSSLKARKSVVLFKRKFDELETVDALRGLLGEEFGKKYGSGSSDKKSFSLTYENYLFVLICLLVDDNTLLSRTSNLITLNVNQAQNSGDTLSTLSFKMADTVTAVEATCKVKEDFVVLPKNILELYLKGTGTESLINVLEDHYFGYSIIRGY